MDIKDISQGKATLTEQIIEYRGQGRGVNDRSQVLLVIYLSDKENDIVPKQKQFPFHFALNLFPPDTASTPVSLSTSLLLQFAAAAEIQAFSTRLIFFKTIPGNKSFMSRLLCPFLSHVLHFQALQSFSLDCVICLLVHLFSWLIFFPPISVVSYQVSVIFFKNHNHYDTICHFMHFIVKKLNKNRSEWNTHILFT